MKHIIITGGAQGIGKITSLKLIENGYRVSVFDIDKEAINEFRNENLSLQIDFFVTDVSSSKSVIGSVKKSIRRFGNVSGLVNNAAIHANKPLKDLTIPEWDKVIGVNLNGVFICVKHTMDYLIETKGSIINIASTRALQSESGTEAYSASKGGIVSLTHALAVSLGPDVKVNCISPGWIDVSNIKKKENARPVQISQADHMQHPAGRVGKANDVSNMILFLLNPENSFITGQNFVIDGGMTRKMIYE